MAIGSDYNVKQDLIDAVVAKVFKNDTFAVTGEGLQKALCDMIESLWGQAAGGSGGSPNYIDVTYAQLNVHIGAGTLVPGTWYRFDFENVHDVDGSLLANTSVAGYTSVVEKFVVLATATNKISGFALSEQHKYDVIEYNPTQASHGSPAVLDNGTVIRRYDALNDNEAYFDFRNYTVARFSLNMSNLFTGSTINRSSVSYDNSNGGFYFSVRDAAAKSNFRLVQNIEIIKRFPYYSYGAGNIEFFGTTYNMINTTLFTQSFVGTNTGIRLNKGVKDIKITSSTNIKVDSDCNAITIEGCENVDIGNDCTNVVLKNYKNSSIGKSNSKIFLFNSNRVDIGKGNSEIIMVNSSDSQIENSTNNILLFDSPYNNIASKCMSIFCIRNSQKNVFGLMSSFISLGSSTNNDFGSTCTSIDIYGGGYNRFAQGCNVINLLGEQDAAFTGAGTYYSPYSEMAYNTFGLGCSNIVFNYVGGRGNQFGDECKNLSFAGNGQDVVLMNTSFCRGIQNKIFAVSSHADTSYTENLSVINCSFITPCHESVTIDPYSWYSQVITVNQSNRPVEGRGKRYIEVIDSAVANSTVYSFIFTGDSSTYPAFTVTYTSASTGATKASITAGLIINNKN